MQVLRDYQIEAVRAVIHEWQEHQSTLLVAATGSGKTTMLADIIRRVYPRRVLVLAHRSELIDQAVKRIREHTGYSVEVEMADQIAELAYLPQVVVSTIQTQTAGGDGAGRMSKFPPGYFGMICIDEAHHATASTYRRAIDYYKQNPKVKIMGLTATPDRTDEEALGQIYETVAADIEILDCIRGGWLVPIEQQLVSVGTLDLSHVRTTAGDLNGKDLAAVLESEENEQGMIQPSLETLFGLPQQALKAIDPEGWNDYIKTHATKRMKAIAFTASVKQAQTFSDIFNRAVPGMSKWICGKTDKDERETTRKEFASGKVQVVVNCAVWTEGFDEPSVDCIIMAKPTKSRSLFAQMAGRGMRALPGVVDGLATAEERKAAIASSQKKTMLILDFVGNAGRHKLMNATDILAGNYSDDVVARVKEQLAKSGSGRIDKLLEEEEERIREEQRLEAEERAKHEAARKAKLMAKASYVTKSIDPFLAWDLVPSKPRAWDKGRELSEKQAALLQKNGIDPTNMPYHAAKQVLDQMFYRWDRGLATLKQCETLRKHGIPSKDVTREHASKIIDILAKNNWRKPANLDAQLATLPPSAPAKQTPPDAPLPF